ncbi:MAG: metallophosphoesterase family protein [Alphaproteobacteria bacterium]|nr:metallophosphoesterase family protein [Alphaproteobacteria bacterium]
MPAHTPSIPDDTRLYAIGDIHGNTAPLKRLLKMILEDASRHSATYYQLVFLGDYIDRGMDSKGTIEFLMNELPNKMSKVFLRGNHDDAFLRFLEGDFETSSFWLPCGGLATLASYGVDPFKIRATQDLEVLRKALAANVPQTHLDFLNATQLFYALGDYYFAHAGIKPGTKLELQEAEDILWIRGEFLNSHQDHGKIIVHGHSVTNKPEIKPNRIGIDTGAFASGHLTCLILQGNEQSIIST